MDTASFQIDFHNSILKDSTLLYVEDDEILKEEISSLFKDFFKKVFVASNGQEALEIFNQNKTNINIILTDLNMPKLNGVEFIKEVRKIDQELPVLVCTAFNEPDVLVSLIKLNVGDYILKPIQMMTTLKIFNKILTNKNNELLLQKHLKELEDLKSVLEDDNFIIETDKEGIIIHVNDLICKASGYEKEELIGQKNSILKHPDTSNDFVKNLWETISSGQKWQGKIKNLGKDGNTFFVKTTIIPIFDEKKNITKFLSTGFLITQEEEEKQHLKRLILQQKGERLKIEHDLQKRVNEEVHKNMLDIANENKIEKEKLISLIHELDAEIKRLRSKHHDNSSRVLTLENRLKESIDRFDNMQKSYQERVQSINTTAMKLAKKCEDLIKKNKIYSEKYEKAQDSIKVLQSYIDEYRAKIENLQDVIFSYEKDSGKKLI